MGEKLFKRAAPQRTLERKEKTKKPQPTWSNQPN